MVLARRRKAQEPSPEITSQESEDNTPSYDSTPLDEHNVVTHHHVGTRLV